MDPKILELAQKITPFLLPVLPYLFKIGLDFGQISPSARPIAGWNHDKPALIPASSQSSPTVA